MTSHSDSTAAKLIREQARHGGGCEVWEKGECDCGGMEKAALSIASDYLELEEQLQAAQEVVRLVVRYDDAVLAWDAMKGHDIETQKAKNAASAEAGRICDEMIAAARAASSPASESTGE